MAIDDDNENLSRKVRKLAVDHAETRWLALRVDHDVKELRSDFGRLSQPSCDPRA